MKLDVGNWKLEKEDRKWKLEVGEAYKQAAIWTTFFIFTVVKGQTRSVVHTTEHEKHELYLTKRLKIKKLSMSSDQNIAQPEITRRSIVVLYSETL